jgi:hypothetical protein
VAKRLELGDECHGMNLGLRWLGIAPRQQKQ